MMMSVTFPPGRPLSNFLLEGTIMKLTVYFDGTFWFALVEHVNRKGQYKVFRYPFGKEPKDSDIWNFIAKKLPSLIKKYDHIKTSSHADSIPQPKKMNPNPSVCKGFLINPKNSLRFLLRLRQRCKSFMRL